MTRTKKLVIGGLAIAALGAASVAAVAGHRGHHGWGGYGHHGGMGKHGRMGKMGMHGGFMGHGLRFVCRRNSAEKIDHMLVHLKHRAELTDAQMPTFEEFSDTVRSAAAKMKESCPPKPEWRKSKADGEEQDGDAAAKPQRPSPIERLARMETMMVAALEAIRTVRPSAEKLYATLSDEQKAKFTERRGKRGWGKHRGGKKHWRQHRGSRSDDGQGPSRGDGPDSGPDDTSDDGDDT